MEIISKMVASGCFIGIAICAADIIKPDDRFSGHIRLIFSLIFTLVFFSPLIKSKPLEILNCQAEYDSEVMADSVGNAVDAEMKKAVEQNISNTLGGKLREENILYDEISVNVNIDDSSSIIINEVCITTQNFDEAKKIIENQLGSGVIIYEGEKNE